MLDSTTTEIVNNTIYGVSHDAIFTTIFAIFIFVSGILINKGYFYFKEKRRLIELEKYFLDFVDSLIEPIEKQADAYMELSQNILDKESRNFEFKENSELFFENLSKVPQLDIYTIFITNKKSSKESKFFHFKNILNSIEFIKLQKERTKHNFIKFFEDNRRYEEQWNNNVDTLIRYFDNFLSLAKRNDVPPSKDPFLKEYDLILDRLKKVDNFMNLYVAKENFIDPLKLLCQETITDPRAAQLLPYIVHANYAFKNIVNLKEFYSNAFKVDADKLYKRKRLINEAISFYKNA